jgi:hypothetical protein
MANLSVKITFGPQGARGYDDWITTLRNIQAEPIRLTSALPYAYGIEFGRHRFGKLARKAGGAFYMAAARNRIKQEAAGELRSAAAYGPGAVALAWASLGPNGLIAARAMVPVVSGALRDSMQSWLGDRRIS